jgi:hypothetical protein
MPENVNETNRYESLLRLTPTQVIAIDVLDCGGTQTEAAERAGVSRVTVSRWVHHHPAFSAELNRRMVERARRVAAQADELTLRAMALTIRAIDEGDTSVAIQWLRLAGTTLLSNLSRQIERPLTAEAIIAKSTEKAAMSAPLELLADPYRKSTLRGILEMVDDQSTG